MFSKGNVKLIIVLLIIFGIIILALLLGGGCYLLYKIGTSDNTAQNQTTTNRTTPKVTLGWLDYKNARYNFTIKYPQSFAKTESINGDGATFTSESPKITLRVYANSAMGLTTDQYLAMDKESLIIELGGVQEISNQSYTLGNLSGKRVIYQYKDPVLGEETIRDQVCAVLNDIAYNLSLTIGYSDYSEYSKMLEEMAATFSL